MYKTLPVEFSSENTKISATLYLPDLQTENKVPGIVLCQGFAGTKEMLLPAYAEKFAEAGYVALAFDYRGFGGSEGEPGRLVPKLQVEDIKNAITYLTSVDMVDSDRIGLWGTSYGGANAIVAASEDPRVKCLSVQLAFGDGERCITADASQEEVVKLKETLKKLQEKKDTTGKELMMPVGKILSDEQSKAFFKENLEKFPALKVKIPFLTISETMNYKPEAYIKNIQVPVLFVGAEKDGVNPIAETHSLYALASDPKELMVVEGATHFDLYEGEYFNKVIDKQLSWFSKRL